MGKMTFNAGSKRSNKINRCTCGAKKLATEKRCIKCAIRRKDELCGLARAVVSEPEWVDEWQAVDTFTKDISGLTP